MAFIVLALAHILTSNMNAKTDDHFRIPVLDITNPTNDLASALVDAAEKYGFIFIRNHNGAISHTDIDRAFDIVRSRRTKMLINTLD